MSVPSAEHEYRVALLETVATLAGFTRDFSLGPDLYPDVVRADTRARCVFVGDAKASESPQNPSTLARLARYLSAAEHCFPAGADLSVVVAHPLDEPRQSDLWVTALEGLLRDFGIKATWASSIVLDETCVLASLYIASPQRPEASLAPSDSMSIVGHDGADTWACSSTAARDRPLLRRRRPDRGLPARGL